MAASFGEYLEESVDYLLTIVNIRHYFVKSSDFAVQGFTAGASPVLMAARRPAQRRIPERDPPHG